MAKIVKLHSKKESSTKSQKKEKELKEVVNDMKDILDKIENTLENDGSDKTKNTGRRR